jgi:hypothetical protein
MKLLALALLLAAPSAFCQQQQRIPVYFSCTCSDPVGSLYATAFRDLLATSPRYIEGGSPETISPDGNKVHRWHLSVVSEDPSVGQTGEGAAISVVFLIGKDLFVTNYVQACHKDLVPQCAAKTMAFLDKEVHDM